MALLLVPFACTTGSRDSGADIFSLPVSVNPIDAFDIGDGASTPAWDYPDVVNGDGTVTRILWLPPGDAAKFNTIIANLPSIVAKKVVSTPVANFTVQRKHNISNGSLEAPTDALDALMLRGLKPDVDQVTDIVVGIQKSVPEIEVAIRVVEVLETDAFAFGVDSMFRSLENTEGPTKTWFNQGITSMGLPAATGSGGSYSASNAAPFLLDLGTITQGLQVDFLIRALKLFAKTDILNAPHIAVLDGHTATINAGEEIPFFTPQFSGSGFNTVSTTFKNVGIKLYVTPVVVGRDLIRIHLSTAVEVPTGESTFQSGEITVSNPIITVRQAVTTMDVYNGDTAVIGGLLTSSKFDTQNRVPVLGEIPILNVLFSSRGKQTLQSNLIFFLTPKIIDPSRDRRRVITPLEPGEGDPSGESGKNGDDG